MPKVFIRKSSTWPEIKSIFVKKTTGWAEVKNVFVKKTTGWVKVFTKANLPDTTTSPTIRTTNTGTGTVYDGPVATSPQFLNKDLFGKDGVYTNYTSILGRKFTSGTSASALTRSTVISGDLFTSGVTAADRLALDGKYLFYELTVQNGSAANEIYPISSAIKLIKSSPILNDFGWTGAEQVNTQLVFNYSIQNYYYNRIDPDLSYVKWWRSNTTNAGGTLIKSETITSTTTGTPSSTERLGTSYYTPTNADLGYYIVAEITGRSSYTEHYGYTDNYLMGSFPTGAVIATPLTFSNPEVRDYYETDGSLIRNGLDNRNNWPVGTLNTYYWELDGYDSNTTIRIRYRMYNYDTGRYYKPSTGAIQADTLAGANAAYDSYNSDGSGTGYISDISVSGTTAICRDYFDLNSTFFNGGGSGPTWWIEIELSADRGAGRVYEGGYTNAYTTYFTGKAIDSSISVSPTTVGLNTNVTISGSLIGTPATPSTNGYPRQYKVTYGDGTDSGWLPAGEYAYATLNPTYSLTKQYSTAGTYTISIDTIPHFEIEQTSVTVSSTKNPPTIGTPTLSAVGAFTAGQRRLSVPFTAASGSGPAYQIYWYSFATAPGVLVTIDGSGTTSPIIDETGPLTIGKWYAYIRSSATTSTSGSVAPTTTLSNWSAGAEFLVDGTRTLSYDKNTTDTVTSLPSASSGTDPWNGWVTNVSSNTPVRTGYTFDGYNTLANLTGTAYAAGASITLTSNVTLYVKWVPKLYKITFDSLGGTAVSELTQSTVGGSIAQPTNPTKASNSFGGWSTTSGGTTAVTWPRTPTADETLYAMWTSVPTAPTSLTVAVNTGDMVLTFAGGTGTQYDIYYANNNTRPTNQQAFVDFAAVTSPYTTGLTSRGIKRWFYVRKSTGTARSDFYPLTGEGATGYINLLAPPTPVITNSAKTTSSLSWHWTAPTPSTTTEDAPASWDYALTSSATAPTSGITNITTRPLAASPLVTTGLSTFTTYYLHVRAKNADATGSWTSLSATTSPAAFVAPVWNGTMPPWVGGTFVNGNNFRRNASSLQYGWNNGTFSFSGDVATTKGWDFYWSTTAPASTTTARTPTNSFAHSTTTSGTAIGTTFFIYRVNPTYTAASVFGSIRPYQFGTDGNKYVRSAWSGNI